MDVKNNTQMVLGRELHDELFTGMNIFDNQLNILIDWYINSPKLKYDTKKKFEDYIDFRLYWEINEKLERLLW